MISVKTVLRILATFWRGALATHRRQTVYRSILRHSNAHILRDAGVSALRDRFGNIEIGPSTDELLGSCRKR